MLSIDAVVSIAHYILNAEDLFAFLAALRPWNVLGPLEHLYQLGLVVKRSDLWPSLTLNAAMTKSSCISSCEHIAKYYLNVIVQDPQFDVEWLSQYLNPTASVEWAADTFPVTTENMMKWTNLQLTRLVVNPRAETTNTWRELLPQLHHLTHLCVDDDTGDLAQIYEMVANSKQITAFEIYSLKYTLRNADLLHLIKWFSRQPVRVFEWRRGPDWISLDDDLRQELCEAMFNCPTLDRLWLSYFYLEDIDFTNLAFSMKTLSIEEWKTLTSDFLLDLGSRLEGSKLTHLELSGDVDGEFDGIEYLLRALPRSSIKWFSFTELGAYDKSWARLAPLIENCGLDCLILSYEDFKSTVPPHLLSAFQNNQTICELRLEFCQITPDNMKMVIQSFSHPTRLVRTKHIRWVTRKRQEVENSTVKALEDFAAEYGCDFGHEVCQ